MSSDVKPLIYDPGVSDWNTWQERHAREHSILSSAATNILGVGASRSSGTYDPTFQSGPVQYAGPNGTFLGSDNIILGLDLPNPAHARSTPGTGGASLLLGTGGTTNPNRDFWIITDQAFDDTLDGNTLGITAGETQAFGTANGGLLWLLGGASFGGTGGLLLLQGGTSRNRAGGQTILTGGNSSQSLGVSVGPAGDVFVIGGQVGNAGANVHLIMTLLGGIAGDVRIRVNSTILMQFLQFGEIYLTASGTGAGLAGQPLVSGGIGAPAQWAPNNFTGVAVLARLTPGGSNGNLTFASGLCVSYLPPA